MIDLSRKLKNFGPLELLVISSLAYVIIMLIWTASTRSAVVQKANDIKFNHKTVVEFIDDALKSHENPQKLDSISKDVIDFMKGRPLFKA